MSPVSWRDDRLTLRDGRMLAYRDCGDPAAPALIYCHGFPGSRFEHEGPCGEAASRGLRVIAPERPGYGRSDPLPGRSVQGWAKDLEELLAHLGVEQVRVLGFSGGGAYALACAAALPRQAERAAIIAALGPVTDPDFADTVPDPMQQFLAAARTAPDAFRAQVQASAPDGAMLLRFMLDGLSRCDAETMGRADRRQSYERSLSVALEQGPQGILEDAVALGSPWGFALRDVACPVNVWHGEEDLKVPPVAAARFARELTLGEHLRLPGCGHFPGDREWAIVIDRLTGR